MANITNKFNLPEVFSTFHRGDKYTRGEADISVTELIAPPQIRILRERHHNEFESDVSDYFWALMGRAVHHILEMGSPDDAIAEMRLFAEVRGWTLSGQVDQIIDEPAGMEITDYKTTKAMSVNYDKIDWETQLNSYAWLARKSFGRPIRALFVLAIYRDWDEFEMSRIKAGGSKYPDGPAQVVPIRLWLDEEQDAYIDERIALHQSAAQAFDQGDPLPECSPAERWEKQEWWKVQKPNAKRAHRVFPTLKAAEKFRQELKKSDDYIVHHALGESTRCERDFCRVQQWCTQYRSMKNGGNDIDAEEVSGSRGGPKESEGTTEQDAAE